MTFNCCWGSALALQKKEVGVLQQILRQVCSRSGPHQTEPTERSGLRLDCNQLILKESEWDSSVGSACWGDQLYNLPLMFLERSKNSNIFKITVSGPGPSSISLVENDQSEMAKLPQGLSHKRQNACWRKTNSVRQQVVPVINGPQGLKINGLSLSRFSHKKPELTERNRSKL